MEPSYCVTVELDVTHFLGRVRPSGCSFTFSMVHLVTSCAQEIEEFRYRFLDGRVVLYRKINTACTYLDEQSDLFKVVYVPMQDSLSDYLAEAAARVKAQKEYFTGPLANDVFQFSPMLFPLRRMHPLLYSIGASIRYRMANGCFLSLCRRIIRLCMVCISQSSLIQYRSVWMRSSEEYSGSSVVLATQSHRCTGRLPSLVCGRFQYSQACHR